MRAFLFFYCGRRRRWKRARRRRAGASAPRQPRATVSASSRNRAGICNSSAAATEGRVNGEWRTIMSRIVSLWLPRWPIFRALAAQAKHPSGKPVDPDRPFVLVVVATGGPRIAALNAAAEVLGLAAGDLLADARAKAEFLQARDADPAADDAALRRLALWATRYTPTASPWNEDNGADGFFLDIAGSAHLFGGEEKLLADLASRLQKNFGLPARLAVADTPGAAWALSRFHKTPAFVLPSGP